MNYIYLFFYREIFHEGIGNLLVTNTLNQTSSLRIFALAKIRQHFENQTKRLAAYEESLKIFRDLNNVISTAEWKGEAKGHAKGLEEGKLEMARKMKAAGIPFNTIQKISGLNLSDIEGI